MTPKPRRRVPARTPPARRAPESGRRAGRLLVRGIVALLLLAAVYLLARHPWAGGPPSDPLARLATTALAERADALERQGHYLASVPYIRRLLRAGPPSYAQASRASTTLNNAAIEVREKDGHVMPASRSSVERVALIRESLEWSRRAEEMAPSPDYRTVEIGAHAEQLSSWGFHREAFGEFVRASEAGPLDAQFLSEARWEQVMLADPTTVVPGAPGHAPPAVDPDSSARPADRTRGH